MGQRTQIIVNRTSIYGEKRFPPFALHNQWGFGRPTVTGAIAILRYIKGCEYEHTINEDTIKTIACRPFGLDELFNRSKPYACSPIFFDSEHDNNDGYAILDIDKGKGRYDVHFYNREGEKLSWREYITYNNAWDYCSPERLEWMEKQCAILSIDFQ